MTTMSDKFPPKNSGFRLETYRLPAPSVPVVEADEADRPKAAEVLARDYVLDHSLEPDLDPEDYDALNRNEADRLIAALLAHGSEHGVAILADGTLRPLTEGEASDA